MAQSDPDFLWGSPYLCIHGLTYSDQLWRANTYWEGRVLGVSHAVAYCTNLSRGLSAIAEFLVYCWQQQHYRKMRIHFCGNPAWFFSIPAGVPQYLFSSSRGNPTKSAFIPRNRAVPVTNSRVVCSLVLTGGGSTTENTVLENRHPVLSSSPPLFGCPHSFMYPWAVESSPLVFGVSVTNLNEPPRALAASIITWVRN